MTETTEGSTSEPKTWISRVMAIVGAIAIAAIIIGASYAVFTLVTMIMDAVPVLASRESVAEQETRMGNGIALLFSAPAQEGEVEIVSWECDRYGEHTVLTSLTINNHPEHGFWAALPRSQLTIGKPVVIRGSFPDGSTVTIVHLQYLSLQYHKFEFKHGYAGPMTFTPDPAGIPLIKLPPFAS